MVCTMAVASESPLGQALEHSPSNVTAPQAKAPSGGPMVTPQRSHPSSSSSSFRSTSSASRPSPLCSALSVHPVWSSFASSEGICGLLQSPSFLVTFLVLFSSLCAVDAHWQENLSPKRRIHLSKCSTLWPSKSISHL